MASPTGSNPQRKRKRNCTSIRVWQSDIPQFSRFVCIEAHSEYTKRPRIQATSDTALASSARPANVQIYKSEGPTDANCRRILDDSPLRFVFRGDSSSSVPKGNRVMKGESVRCPQLPLSFRAALYPFPWVFTLSTSVAHFYAGDWFTFTLAKWFKLILATGSLLY